MFYLATWHRNQYSTPLAEGWYIPAQRETPNNKWADNEEEVWGSVFSPRQPLSNRGVNLLTAQSYRSGLVINCEQCTGHSCEVQPAEPQWGQDAERGSTQNERRSTASAVSWCRNWYHKHFWRFDNQSNTFNCGGLHQQCGCNKDKYVGQLTCVLVAGARCACGVSPSSRLTVVLVCVRCMNGFMKLLRNHPKVFWHTSAPPLSFISAANWHHKWLQGFYGHQL